MNKLIWIVLGIVLITFSCTKEKIVTESVDKEYSWKQDSRIQYEQTILMNSHYYEGILYLLGNYNYTKISISEELPNNPESEVINYSLVFDYQFDSKFPITDYYYIAASNENKRLVVAPNYIPNYNLSWKIIPFELIDSNFYEFELINYQSGICLGVNERDFCLVPYRTINNNIISNCPRFLLIKFSVGSEAYEYRVDTVYTKLIDYPQGYDYGPEFVRSLSSLEDGFIFSGLEDTYKIDTLGNISKVYDGRIMRIIKKENDLLGFTTSQLIKSTDSGITWNELANIGSDFSIMNYCTINDSLVGYYNSQIFKIIVKEREITVLEIDNEGLEGKSITSMTEAADSLIYVTTLNGLFYKNYEDFFTSD